MDAMIMRERNLIVKMVFESFVEVINRIYSFDIFNIILKRISLWGVQCQIKVIVTPKNFGSGVLTQKLVRDLRLVWNKIYDNDYQHGNCTLIHEILLLRTMRRSAPDFCSWVHSFSGIELYQLISIR